jgi:hypothetical protein
MVAVRDIERAGSRSSTRTGKWNDQILGVASRLLLGMTERLSWPTIRIPQPGGVRRLGKTI